MSHDLRITLRCLIDDVGLSENDALKPLSSLAELSNDAGALIKAFLEKRTPMAIGADDDRMSDLATGGIPQYKLRRGQRIRALTWFDPETNTVFMTAAHFRHRSGEATDSYPYFRSLASEDLMPTEEDYQLLRGIQARAFWIQLFEELDPAVEAAVAEPGREVRVLLGPIPVSLLCTRPDPPPHVRLAISMRWTDPDFEPEPPPEAIVAIVTRVYRPKVRGLGRFALRRRCLNLWYSSCRQRNCL